MAFRDLAMRNRIMVSPMCQYSSVEGCVSDWHRAHLGQFAIGGAGLLVIEMTNVQDVGRISPYCVGLYDDANETSLRELVAYCRRIGDVPIGIQLAHAGRKASTAPPWEDRRPLSAQDGGWETVAPSPIAPDERSPPPKELSEPEIHELVSSFEQSAKRAERIGIEAIELHAAHGYLLHQFLSPLSNRRNDRYGGSAENRMRFPLEVFEAVRGAFPDGKPVGVRVSATDWAPGGWTVEQTIKFARRLKSMGCDWIDVSSGGLVSRQKVRTGPGYQVKFAQAVREQAEIPTIAVGMITDPMHAEQIVRDGCADVVALARGMLYNPRWVWHAADALGVNVAYPDQYLRCRLDARERTH